MRGNTIPTCLKWKKYFSGILDIYLTKLQGNYFRNGTIIYDLDKKAVKFEFDKKR
jgi:hypothetical protein